MPFELSALETRILGCLLEKERLTPENYPLSLNSLTNACNQSTNREPVTSYDEKSVDTGISSLREKKLATMIQMAGSRVPKYRHRLPDHFTLEPKETALLCILLLRGPQTPGELRQRTERMFTFSTLEEVENCLQSLEKDPGLVSLLPPRPGQKERRYIQRLSAESAFAEAVGDAPIVEAPAGPSLPDRVAQLEAQVQGLQAELQQVREELASFRKQFE